MGRIRDIVRHNIAIAVVAVVAAGTFWFAYSRVVAGRSKVDEFVKENDALVVLAGTRLDELLAGDAGINVATLSESIAFGDALDRAVQAAPRGKVSIELANKLSLESKELLASRYGRDATPEAYLETYRTRGYSVASRYRIEQLIGMKTIEGISGKPLPPDASVEDMFAALWEGIDAQKSSAWTQIVAADRICVAFDVATVNDPDPELGCDAFEDVEWIGSSYGTMHPFILPPRSFEDALRARSEVSVARIGMMVRCADDHHVSMFLNYFLDNGTWWLNSAMVSNAPLERRVQIVY